MSTSDEIKEQIHSLVDDRLTEVEIRTLEQLLEDLWSEAYNSGNSNGAYA